MYHTHTHTRTHYVKSSQHHKSLDANRALGTGQLDFSSGHQNNVDIVMKAGRLSAVQAHKGCSEARPDPP